MNDAELVAHYITMRRHQGEAAEDFQDRLSDICAEIVRRNLVPFLIYLYALDF